MNNKPSANSNKKPAPKKKLQDALRKNLSRRKQSDDNKK